MLREKAAESARLKLEGAKELGKDWSEKDGVLINDGGSKGGGLPPNLPNWLKPLEREFDDEYMNKAAEDQGVDPEDADPLQYGEGPLGDSGGFVLLSPKKLPDSKLEDLTNGVLYWSVNKTVKYDGKTWFAYAGVSGV